MCPWTCAEYGSRKRQGWFRKRSHCPASVKSSRDGTDVRLGVDTSDLLAALTLPTACREPISLIRTEGRASRDARDTGEGESVTPPCAEPMRRGSCPRTPRPLRNDPIIGKRRRRPPPDDPIISLEPSRALRDDRITSQGVARMLARWSEHPADAIEHPHGWSFHVARPTPRVSG